MTTAEFLRGIKNHVTYSNGVSKITFYMPIPTSARQPLPQNLAVKINGKLNVVPYVKAKLFREALEEGGYRIVG